MTTDLDDEARQVVVKLLDVARAGADQPVPRSPGSAMRPEVMLLVAVVVVVVVVTVELLAAVLPLVIVMLFVPPAERAGLADLLAAVDSSPQAAVVAGGEGRRGRSPSSARGGRGATAKAL